MINVSDIVLIALFLINAVVLRKPLVIIIALLLVTIIDSILKKCLSSLKSYRPVHPINTKDSRLGMPSGHAMSAFFLAVTIICQSDVSTTVKLIVLVMAFSVSSLRVFEFKHTIPQITVGILLGFVAGLALNNVVYSKESDASIIKS
jgi:membrane-associated phospholipid phosphatase